MALTIGEKYLITTQNYFFAPDGQSYTAVHGTVVAIESPQDALGILGVGEGVQGFVTIGTAILPLDSIDCIISCDVCCTDDYQREEYEGNGKLFLIGAPSRIYLTD